MGVIISAIQEMVGLGPSLAGRSPPLYVGQIARRVRRAINAVPSGSKDVPAIGRLPGRSARRQVPILTVAIVASEGPAHAFSTGHS